MKKTRNELIRHHQLEGTLFILLCQMLGAPQKKEDFEEFIIFSFPDEFHIAGIYFAVFVELVNYGNVHTAGIPLSFTTTIGDTEKLKKLIGAVKMRKYYNWSAN